MTEGGRPAHRRERGKYPLRGNLHTEGGLQRDLYAKRRGDYPLRGNLHTERGLKRDLHAEGRGDYPLRGTCTEKGEITLRRKRGKSADKGRDTPVRQRK